MENFLINILFKYNSIGLFKIIIKQFIKYGGRKAERSWRRICTISQLSCLKSHGTPSPSVYAYEPQWYLVIRIS